jgi:hypothetical protein
MFTAPIPIGPFLVEEDGQIRLRQPDREPAFTFRWRNTGFNVLLSQGKLSLGAQAGRVPSTADGANSREAALRLLRALPPALPREIRLRLLPDYRVQLTTEMALAWPTSVASLISPLIAMLRHMAPVLDILEEGGLHAP